MNHSDPFDIQSQERAIADNSDKAKLAHEVEIDDLKWLMGDKRGRRFMRGVFKRGLLDTVIFNTNAMTMGFMSGRQVEAGYQKSLIELHCMNRYVEMINESKKP
jgi:hypothetical protein